MARARQVQKAPTPGMHRVHSMGPQALSADEIAERRVTTPETSCFFCGDRGWCKHRTPPAGVSHGLHAV